MAAPALADWQVQIGTVILGPGTDYLIHDYSGLGIVGVRTSDVPRPQDDGDFYGDDFHDSRAISLPITVRGDSPEEAWQNFKTLAAEWYLHRGEDTRPLYYKLPGQPVLTVEGRPRRLPADNSRLVGRRVKVEAEYYTADAVVYGDEVTTSIFLPVASSGRTYDRTYNRAYGAGTSDIVSVNNGGDYPTRPTITIYGPVTNPSIENVSTGQTLAFDITLTSDDYLELDVDAHSVLLNGTASRRYTLRAGSEWFDLDPGDSSVRFVADNYDASARADVTARPAWISG